MTLSRNPTSLEKSLFEYVDDPSALYLAAHDLDLSAFDRSTVEEFQLASARELLKRQVDRVPIVGELLNGRGPESFESLDDFVSILLSDDAYKGYGDALADPPDYVALTNWLDRFTSHDLSVVDMSDCVSLTEWCRRLDEHADIFICHSSGTSGNLSFVPRSRRDLDLVVDEFVYSARPLFEPYGSNDVTFFSLTPRRLYRVRQAVCDGLEGRHGANPSRLIDVFHSPEFHIAQGRMRQAAARGTANELADDSFVSAYGAEVDRFNQDLPRLTKEWTDTLINEYRGERVYFRGSFDRAWRVARQFIEEGVTGAFAPESVFVLTGGVKDGSTLPSDWMEQFRQTLGVPESNLTSIWGMSEVTGVVPRCTNGMYHFPLTMVPFLLEPYTRNPLPRSGVQSGQIGLLELNSLDCWGGFVSGDRGTIDWDLECACGRQGAVLDAASISRL